LTVGKGHKTIALEKVEDALAKQIHDDANVATVIKAVSQMNTAISIVVVVGFQGRQNTQLYPRSIAVLLNRADYLDGYSSISFPVASLDHLAEGALAEEAIDLI
jgi:predicted ABC-type ATPase